MALAHPLDEESKWESGSSTWMLREGSQHGGGVEEGGDGVGGKGLQNSQGKSQSR